MGGRGGSSGLGSFSRATPEQTRLMNNLRKRNEKNDTYSQPTFKMNKDGSVSYEYTQKRIIHHVHGGKMQSEEKNDVYERTERYSGTIMPDGLRKQNKTTKEDVLIRKGREKKRKKKK